MLHGEPAPRAAEAGDDFVGDHQHVQLVADGADLLEPSDGRHDEAAGGQHRLEDHRRHGVRPFAHDGLAQLAPAPLDQLRVGPRAAIAVGVRRRELGEAFRLELGVGGGQLRQAADGVGAHRGAVIAAEERDDLVLVGLALRHPVVPRNLHRALVGFRAADGEHGEIEIAGRERGELRRQLCGGAIRELARCRIVGELDGLLGDGLGDLPAPVADVDHGQSREAVHQLLALLGPDPDTLGAIDDQLFVREPGVILRLVRPEMSNLA
jgi:hypothetical protein